MDSDILTDDICSMEEACCTYILKCADGSIYCGWTVNLEDRIRAHNQGKGAKYTRSRLPVKLLKAWEFSNRSEAMKFESYVKGLSRKKKEELMLNDTSLYS